MKFNGETGDDLIQFTEVDDPLAGMISMMERQHLEDLPEFSGSLDTYPSFYEFYKDTEMHFKAHENLERLTNALKDEPLEFVEDELSDGDVDKVIKKLDSRYGYQILKRTVTELQYLKIPRDLTIELTIKLRNQLSNGFCILKSLRADRYLMDPILTDNLIEKFPNDTKLEWRRYVSEQLKIQHGGVSFECFFKWFIQETEWVLQVPSEALEPTRTKNCWYCKAGNHEISTCSKFIEAPVDRRFEFVIERSICITCLSHASKRTCFLKFRKCGKDNCKKNHHPLLHKDAESDEKESKHDKIGYCEICQENDKSRLCYPCGHFCLCDICSGRLLKQNGEKLCPLCRDPVTEIIKVYV
jgi:hypothetical protein